MNKPPEELHHPSRATGGTVYLKRAFSRESARGTVLLLHGLGDHLGRHDWAFELLTASRYDVIALDWPGCGRSSGERGDLPAIDEAGALVSEVLALFDVEPVGVMGHSTGAFYLIHFLSRSLPCFSGLRWAWLSSPLIEPRSGHGRLKIEIAKSLARIFPRMTLTTGVRNADCFHPGPGENGNRLSEGCHNRVSLRFGATLLSSPLGSLLPNLPRDLCYLLTHGSEDRVCPPEFAFPFFGGIAAPGKTSLFVAGARHEPFREPFAFSFLSGLKRWLETEKELPKSSPAFSLTDRHSSIG